MENDPRVDRLTCAEPLYNRWTLRNETEIPRVSASYLYRLQKYLLNDFVINRLFVKFF